MHGYRAAIGGTRRAKVNRGTCEYGRGCGRNRAARSTRSAAASRSDPRAAVSGPCWEPPVSGRGTTFRIVDRKNSRPRGCKARNPTLGYCECTARGADRDFHRFYQNGAARSESELWSSARIGEALFFEGMTPGMLQNPSEASEATRDGDTGPECREN